MSNQKNVKTVRTVIGFLVSSRRQSCVDNNVSQGVKEMYYLGASTDYLATYSGKGLPGARNGRVS